MIFIFTLKNKIVIKLNSKHKKINKINVFFWGGGGGGNKNLKQYLHLLFLCLNPFCLLDNKYLKMPLMKYKIWTIEKL